MFINILAQSKVIHLCGWLFYFTKFSLRGVTEIAKWTNQEWITANELRKQGKTDSEIGRLLTSSFGRSFSEDSVRRKFVRENEKDELIQVSSNSSNSKEWNSDGVQTSNTILNVVSGDSLTEDELLQAHNLDPEEFEIARGTSNFYKQTEQTTAFQTKIQYVPRKNLRRDDLIKLFDEEQTQFHYEKAEGGTRNLVIPLADLHFGWTKFEDIEENLAEIIGVVESKTWNKIVIEQLGDLFHSDQITSSQTVSGTLLDDVDMRQGFKDAIRFFDALVPAVLKHSGSVELKSVFGNHSGDLEFAMLYGLENRYPDMDIDFNDDNPASDWRMAYNLDNVAIMLSHGSYATTRLKGLFPAEYKNVWAKGKTAEIHSGHFHTQKTSDASNDGIVWRQLGTPKPNDPYEVKNGYTTSKKVMYLFEYDADRLRVTYEM